MEYVDVHDLPEEQARFVAAFVEFLRKSQLGLQDSITQERDWQTAPITSCIKDWDNDESAIYDAWRKRYHSREG